MSKNVLAIPVPVIALNEESLALLRKHLLEDDPVATDEIERRFEQELDKRR